MPRLARRMSNSSVASASSTQSFPATIESSTKVSKEKVGRIMSRRSIRGKQAAMPMPPTDNKENVSENLVQSPTPYWKVAKDRGGANTPPETRSSKKRKHTGGTKLDFALANSREGLMIFSPPDQEENARREREEIQRKEQAREKRIRRARTSGQLMVFSPTFRDPKDQNSQSPESATNGSINTSIDTNTLDGKGSESEAQVSFDSHMARTEELLLNNAKLEAQIAKLEHDIAEQRSREFNERESHEKKMQQLSAELSSRSAEVDSLKEALEASHNEANREAERLQLLINELAQDKKDLERKLKAGEKRESKLQTKLEELDLNFKDEKTELIEERRVAEQNAKELQTRFESLQDENRHLQVENDKLEKKLDILENTLLAEADDQLQEAKRQCDELRKSEEGLRSQLAEAGQQVASLETNMEQVIHEQEEERKNFQTLNEDSGKAFEQLNKELESKDKHIKNLENELEESASKQASESAETVAISKKLTIVQKEMQKEIVVLKNALLDTEAKLGAEAQRSSSLEVELHKARNQILQDKEFRREAEANNTEKVASIHQLQQRISTLEAMLSTSETKCAEISNRLVTFDQREEALLAKLMEGDRVRRGLHNRVMQLSGNIRVYVRVRPALPFDTCVVGNAKTGESVEPEDMFRFPGMGGLENNSSSAFGADDVTKNLVEVTEPKKDRGGLSERRKRWTFGFDNIFTPTHGQEDIWEATEPLVQSAVDGYNVTIFAYGQTGSGKSYTMLGEGNHDGIVSRAVRKLFQAKNEIVELSKGKSTVDISVELLEVYNENVRDLLVSSSDIDGKGVSLKVKANEAVGSRIEPAHAVQDVERILAKAQSRRCVKATASNAVSSRSHMLFTIYFKVTSKDGSVRTGKLNVCDLAGSERLGKSHANEHVGGALMKETKHINTSLSVLSNVIEKLQAGGSNIPYRESKLTYLLQNSLGGNSKTLAIVCCNPMQAHFHETLCSLRFAAKVNKVDLKAIANFKA
eukprot:Nitzschia sp. Nitz4//scaffold7_size249615//46813//49980//NITZ4_001150-RA/size249615-processed-gene-0.180-mRNA-1//-1//CDS//3329558361//3567//frame0